MTAIKSETKTVAYSSKVIFDFIRNFENFRDLLPQEKVENYVVDGDSCTFRIKGMTDLGLKLGETNEATKVEMLSHGKVPFPFKMDIVIQEIDASSSEVHIDFNGEINSFMVMMIEKPLTNFFNMLVDRLSQLELS
ncbi:MAG: hypothetical protein RIC15_08790 [Vicingaceae bacterium]